MSERSPRLVRYNIPLGNLAIEEGGTPRLLRVPLPCPFATGNYGAFFKIQNVFPVTNNVSE